MSKFPSGVITGDGVQAIFNDAQENEYALPAVSVVGTNSVNRCWKRLVNSRNDRFQMVEVVFLRENLSIMLDRNQR